MDQREGRMDLFESWRFLWDLFMKLEPWGCNARYGLLTRRIGISACRYTPLL